MIIILLNLNAFYDNILILIKKNEFNKILVKIIKFTYL